MTMMATANSDVILMMTVMIKHTNRFANTNVDGDADDYDDDDLFSLTFSQRRTDGLVLHFLSLPMPH